MNGLVVYCETHDQGAIILDKENYFKHLTKYDCILDNNLDKICFPVSGINNTRRLCSWIKHGNCRLENNLLKYNSLSKKNYEDMYGGWDNEYFKSEVYNSQIEKNNEKFIIRHIKNQSLIYE